MWIFSYRRNYIILLPLPDHFYWDLKLSCHEIHLNFWPIKIRLYTRLVVFPVNQTSFPDKWYAASSIRAYLRNQPPFPPITSAHLTNSRCHQLIRFTYIRLTYKVYISIRLNPFVTSVDRMPFIASFYLLSPWLTSLYHGGKWTMAVKT